MDDFIYVGFSRTLGRLVVKDKAFTAFMDTLSDKEIKFSNSPKQKADLCDRATASGVTIADGVGGYVAYYGVRTSNVEGQTYKYFDVTFAATDVKPVRQLSVSLNDSNTESLIRKLVLNTEGTVSMNDDIVIQMFLTEPTKNEAKGKEYINFGTSVIRNGAELAIAKEDAVSKYNAECKGVSRTKEVIAARLEFFEKLVMELPAEVRGVPLKPAKVIL